MKKSSSVLMAALTLTAIVLAVILLASPQREAQAVMLNNQPGLVMMTTGQANGPDEQLVILDKTSGKMLVYRLNGANFELMGNMDVAAIFNRAGPVMPAGR